ncbi:unnamed protein product [Schistocephalus solidus]|uniref:Secreted protein n=1 Tax=Schistocephalus solidus TaxID=70667 RepID=A0A183TLS5_SCHSO|nr:unnamed protein product [Schistocephalus solidus]
MCPSSSVETIFAFTFSTPPLKLASPTLDNLDTSFRFCNTGDGLRDLLMIVAGSDVSTSVGGLRSQQGRITVMIS